VDEGGLKPHVSRVLELEELAEGHRLQESGHVAGKIVVWVKA
jgi:NADPH:quinone reductase-like Zn-dependent oxidoreductase